MNDKSGKMNEYNGAAIDFLPSLSAVSSPADLKTVLSGLLEGVKGKDIPSIYALMLLNGILGRGDIYEIMNKENRLLGVQVWDFLRSSGIQLECPPIFQD